MLRDRLRQAVVFPETERKSDWEPQLSVDFLFDQAVILARKSSTESSSIVSVIIACFILLLAVSYRYDVAQALGNTNLEGVQAAGRPTATVTPTRTPEITPEQLPAFKNLLATLSDEEWKTLLTEEYYNQLKKVDIDLEELVKRVIPIEVSQRSSALIAQYTDQYNYALSKSDVEEIQEQLSNVGTSKFTRDPRFGKVEVEGNTVTVYAAHDKQSILLQFRVPEGSSIEQTGPITAKSDLYGTVIVFEGLQTLRNSNEKAGTTAQGGQKKILVYHQSLFEGLSLGDTKALDSKKLQEQLEGPYIEELSISTTVDLVVIDGVVLGIDPEKNEGVLVLAGPLQFENSRRRKTYPLYYPYVAMIDAAAIGKKLGPQMLYPDGVHIDDLRVFAVRPTLSGIGSMYTQSDNHVRTITFEIMATATDPAGQKYQVEGVVNVDLLLFGGIPKLQLTPGKQDIWAELLPSDAEESPAAQSEQTVVEKENTVLESIAEPQMKALWQFVVALHTDQSADGPAIAIMGTNPEDIYAASVTSGQLTLTSSYFDPKAPQEIAIVFDQNNWEGIMGKIQWVPLGDESGFYLLTSSFKSDYTPGDTMREWAKDFKLPLMVSSSQNSDVAMGVKNSVVKNNGIDSLKAAIQDQLPDLKTTPLFATEEEKNKKVETIAGKELLAFVEALKSSLSKNKVTEFDAMIGGYQLTTLAENPYLFDAISETGEELSFAIDMYANSARGSITSGTVRFENDVVIITDNDENPDLSATVTDVIWELPWKVQFEVTAEHREQWSFKNFQ